MNREYHRWRSPALGRGGAFDIRQFIDGCYDDDVYAKNPVDYLPNLTDRCCLDRNRSGVGLIPGTGGHNTCVDQNRRLSGILDGKDIPQLLDAWGDAAAHGWPWRQRMSAKFIQKLFEEVR